jgi:hypothetical protein
VGSKDVKAERIGSEEDMSDDSDQDVVAHGIQ